MRSPVTFRLVCSLVSCVAVLAACSDPPPASGPIGVGDTGGAGGGEVKLGEGVGSDAKDGTTSDAQDALAGTDEVAAPDDTLVEDAAADDVTPDPDGAIPDPDSTVPDTEDGATAPVACTDDAGCEGKVKPAACQKAACGADGFCTTVAAADKSPCDAGNNFCVTGDTTCKAGVCSGTPTVCDDQNACTEDSCDPAKACQYKPTTAACDDGDPCTKGDVCAEGKCQAGTGTCATTEVDCANKLDDDGDGSTDCADNECAENAGCKALPKESDCANKLDDDADGTTDCGDADCAGNDACALAATEGNCTDAKDGDGDGAVDCADNDCAGDAACGPIKEFDCANKVDDDKDTKVDCADSDCAADAACKPGTPEADCVNKLDDDKDGATDCADNDCSVNLACAVAPEADCGNKVDDDKDGKTDCLDSDCAGKAACPIKETDCANKLDDDKDGKIDCADSDCAAVPACASKCAHDVCVEGVKLVATCDPCAASVCKADPFCCSTGWDDQCVAKVKKECGKDCAALPKEGDCKDGKDGDADGLVDCFDPDCKGNVACPAKEIDCKNAKDDDADGLVDCGDGDCALDLACAVTQCKDDNNLLCGGSDKHGNAAAGSTDKVKDYECKDGKANGETGNEYTYKFVAECDGNVTLTLLKTSTKPGYLDLFVLDGAKACGGATCLAHALMSGTTATKTFAAKKGQAFFVVVDGYAEFAGEFSIKAQCGCAGGKELDCGDKLDNDLDGATDCKDGDCAAALACAPTESNCTDKVDNDKDGKVDCADTDCIGKTGCVCKGAEAIGCDKADSWNNGGLGSTKVVDKYTCLDGIVSNETGPEYAYDYVATCTGDLTVTLNKTSGANSSFLDLFVLDGAKACGGSSCLGHALMAGNTLTKKVSVTKGQKLTLVVDGYQTFVGNFTLKTACKCAPVVETKCGNKLDDDGDTKIDCDDTDCAKSEECLAGEQTCADKVDNDADGKTDCADTDCAVDIACGATPVEANCTDKLDNDKDGKIDCLDADCAKNAACTTTTTETLCADKVDNDKDGKLDCLDLDCAKDLACTATGTENCTDKIDNDKDGKIDCADSECVGKAGCICKEAFPLACGDTDSFNNAGFESTDVVDGYTCPGGSVGNETGNEYTYGYVAACDGQVTITATKLATTSGFLDLFVLDGTKVCAGTSCLGHALMSGKVATLKFAGKKGVAYKIVVDGFNGYKSDYDIKATCACAATKETNCADKLDDDKDGQIDCADTDCATAPVCIANQCKPDFGLACGGNDEWNNGDEGSTDVVNSYTCADGTVNGQTAPEYTYGFTATCNGTATVKVSQGFFSLGLLNVFVLDASKPCGGSSCLAHGLMGTFSNTVQKSFAVKLGQKFNVVVDAAGGYSNDYKIAMSCACAP